MTLSHPMKALGILLVIFEGACAAFLACMPPVVAILGAMEARGPTDWIFVGITAFALPCVPGIQMVADAFVEDLRELRRNW